MGTTNASALFPDSNCDRFSVGDRRPLYHIVLQIGLDAGGALRPLIDYYFAHHVARLGSVCLAIFDAAKGMFLAALKALINFPWTKHLASMNATLLQMVRVGRQASSIYTFAILAIERTVAVTINPMAAHVVFVILYAETLIVLYRILRVVL